MKNILRLSIVGLSWIFTTGQSIAGSLEASFIDPAWDGKRVPKGQQCQQFGGINPMSPEIKITGIPEGTEAIVLRFNDQTYQPMNNGGHGKIAVLIEPGTTELIFPSVPGHSFDLPEGVLVVAAHRAPEWDIAGAYLPPCSGGENYKYSVTIQPSKIKNLKRKKFKKIERIKLNMGRF